MSSQIETRSTPVEIGAPSLDRFSLVVRNQDGMICYRDKLTDTAIPLATGLYEVSVSCGDNPLIAIDEPYYLGTADNVSVEHGQNTQVDVACSVANSLVSVRFGRDVQEQERFSRLYDSYAVRVHVDGYYATVSDKKSYQSVYFRSGSSVSLEFTGVLKEDGRHVSAMLDLSQTDFPSSFAPAEHAIVTLSLPDPQSLMAIEISAVEIEEVTLQQTIPLSWLPLPGVQVHHAFDAEGRLAGTDIDFGNGYPGFEWKAVVENSANAVMRSVQGDGALASGHDEQGMEYPYLPSGQYRAVFYVIRDGIESETGARDFNVTKPTVDIVADGYTSYSKYLSGDVDGANNCDAYTLYAPSVNIGIAPSLLNNPTYAPSVTTTVNETTLSGTMNGSRISYPDVTNLAPSLTEYTLSCTATFADITVMTQKDVRITGLPAEYAPPTRDAGWNSHGTVNWDVSDSGMSCVRLGQNTTSQPQYITSDRFAIPAGTRMDCPYTVATNGATVGTTLTLSVGDYTYFSKDSGTKFFSSVYNKYDDHVTFTLNADATSVKANNSYGSGQTKSFIHKLSYKYAK
ncbi:MAG: DUF4493 domain-containing protein [Bacteroidaceae bacterium]|nr:DUF4493 domain-containing protein [Bacteroidaceae bacterium]